MTSIHHGFDRDSFFRDDTPLDAEVQRKLGSDQQSDANSQERSGNDAFRLLFVSHYNYYRNFETVLRVLPMLSRRLEGRKIKLFLTCRLRSDENPGTYRANDAVSLVNQLGIADSVVELGSVPYPLLHQVYRACDIYVTPAYAESFAHPLVEAMASGLPVVAADTAGASRDLRGCSYLFPALFPRRTRRRSVQNRGVRTVGAGTCRAWTESIKAVFVEPARG